MRLVIFFVLKSSNIIKYGEKTKEFKMKWPSIATLSIRYYITAPLQGGSATAAMKPCSYGKLKLFSVFNVQYCILYNYYEATGHLLAIV